MPGWGTSNLYDTSASARGGVFSRWNVPNRTYSSSYNPYNTRGGPMQSAGRAWEAARQANEQRYGDILGGYQDRYRTAVGELDKLAGNQRQDLTRQFDEHLQGQYADLNSRGLGNTTVRQSAATGNLRERTSAQNRLEASLAQQKLGLAGEFSKQMLDFMERRNDGFPDPGQIAQMGQQYGQGQSNAGEMINAGYNRHPLYGWYKPGF